MVSMNNNNKRTASKNNNNNNKSTAAVQKWILRAIVIGVAFLYYHVIVNLFLKEQKYENASVITKKAVVATSSSSSSHTSNMRRRPPPPTIAIISHEEEDHDDDDDEVEQRGEAESVILKKKVATSSSNHNNNNNIRRQSPPTMAPTAIISRDDRVKIETDVRGNLGPPSVMIQKVPGHDWLKDRWQAASDMHGTAIPGVHWVTLEFPSVVQSISKIVLDWEAAYARDYRIEVLLSMEEEKLNNNNKTTWIPLFDSHVDSEYRTTTESGQSPGVKTKTPLHIVHTIDFNNNNRQQPFQYLRLYIRKSAMGWGVSLWQLDVYGIMMEE